MQLCYKVVYLSLKKWTNFDIRYSGAGLFVPFLFHFY
jgi:hypothetical protein